MSNNKQSMKLYTEEQMRDAIKMARNGARSEDNIIGSLNFIKPYIELPSDEEIEQEMNNEYPLTGHVGIDHRNYLRKVGSIQGAKWMRDKIKGGNNE